MVVRLHADFRHNAVNRAAAGAFPSLRARRPSDISLEGFAMKPPIPAPLPAARPDERPDRHGERCDRRWNHRH